MLTVGIAAESAVTVDDEDVVTQQRTVLARALQAHALEDHGAQILIKRIDPRGHTGRDPQVEEHHQRVEDVGLVDGDAVHRTRRGTAEQWEQSCRLLELADLLEYALNLADGVPSQHRDDAEG